MREYGKDGTPVYERETREATPLERAAKETVEVMARLADQLSQEMKKRELAERRVAELEKRLAGMSPYAAQKDPPLQVWAPTSGQVFIEDFSCWYEKRRGKPPVLTADMKDTLVWTSHHLTMLAVEVNQLRRITFRLRPTTEASDVI